MLFDAGIGLVKLQSSLGGGVRAAARPAAPSVGAVGAVEIVDVVEATAAPHDEARARTGKPPITVKWVDVNKGDDASPDYRSRLVAREKAEVGGQQLRTHSAAGSFEDDPELGSNEAGVEPYSVECRSHQ